MASPFIIENYKTHIDAKRRPRIVLGACGSVAVMKFGLVIRAFVEWAEVMVVVTDASCRFIDQTSIPYDVIGCRDEEEWKRWNKIGGNVGHIELVNWADIMVIAPLSAHTLAKISGGLCDNLLTSVVRAWDYNKPMFVAPSMNKCMWENPLTKKHLMSIDELGIILIPPHKSSDGEYSDTGAMAEPSTIYKTVRVFCDSNILKKKPGVVYAFN